MNTAMGIAAALLTLGVGVFIMALIAQFSVRILDNHSAKIWAFPVWMAALFCILAPCLIGSFALAGYVAFRLIP